MQDIQKHLEAALEAAMKIEGVYKERLAKAMEREQSLRGQVDTMGLELRDARKRLSTLESDLVEARYQIETMHDHPDVKARRLVEAKAELDRATAKVAFLAQPRPTVADEIKKD